ncbi:MAG: mandelate racemase/muconate lactonizing enzyme family protein [Gemmatimonadetes bacterium]|nr:mandelate racemase/muconate lactonizing enzyme family protein [Gemmatimonadota bacterium]
MRIQDVTLRLLRLPLIKPYRVSFRTHEAFEPILVEVRDEDGGVGWGEGYISHGYSHETIEGGWEFCLQHGRELLGRRSHDAKERITPDLVARSPCAATALVTAVEMLERHPLLRPAREARLPLVEPLGTRDLERVPDEVEALLERGFRTLKLKVGFDVDEDLAVVEAAVAALRGRGTVRLDANHAFSMEDGRRFAEALEPEGIELFEQPCASQDWDANAAVARVSRVAVMLDESIYGPDDIDRAASLEGVGYVKLKLKKLGGLDRLKDGLDRVTRHGLRKVLGDGVSSEIGCWMEACVATVTIDNAGEFNGFLKPRVRLFSEPLSFAAGALLLPAGYWPDLDHDAVAAHTVREERLAAVRA